MRDFGNNAAFFEKYYDRMLVINGVDAQTNSHTAGIIHNWSGRSSEGYPSMTALLAAHHGPGFALLSQLRRFLPDIRSHPVHSRGQFRFDPQYRCPGSPRAETIQGTRRGISTKQTGETLRAFRNANIARLAAAPQLLPRAARNRRLYAGALSPEATEGLKAYAALLPPEDELEQEEESEDRRFHSGLRRQAQLTILAFKARVAVSADFLLGGFDTHANHDLEHNWLLANLTNSVDFLWELAEIHGVADRLVVVIGSDFGRTNHYNVDAGKDHWPIGSFVVMEKNQPWTNRVVGETDALHFARKVHPSKLQRDDAYGTIIHPKHIHKALRQYLGIENSLGAQRFPFHNTEDFAFFG